MKPFPLRLLTLTAALACSLPAACKKEPAAPAAVPPPVPEAVPAASAPTGQSAAAAALFDACAAKVRAAWEKLLAATRESLSLLLTENQSRLKNPPPPPHKTDTAGGHILNDKLDGHLKFLDRQLREFDDHVAEQRKAWEAKNWEGYPVDPAPGAPPPGPDPSPPPAAARADFFARRELAYTELYQTLERRTAEVTTTTAGLRKQFSSDVPVEMLLDVFVERLDRDRNMAHGFTAFETQTARSWREWEEKQWRGYMIVKRTAAVSPPPAPAAAPAVPDAAHIARARKKFNEETEDLLRQTGEAQRGLRDFYIQARDTIEWRAKDQKKPSGLSERDAANFIARFNNEITNLDQKATRQAAQRVDQWKALEAKNWEGWSAEEPPQPAATPEMQAARDDFHKRRTMTRSEISAPKTTRVTEHDKKSLPADLKYLRESPLTNTGVLEIVRREEEHHLFLLEMALEGRQWNDETKKLAAAWEAKNWKGYEPGKTTVIPGRPDTSKSPGNSP